MVNFMCCLVAVHPCATVGGQMVALSMARNCVQGMAGADA